MIGGGFAGATTARYLARWAPRAEVTLVVPPGRYWTCPFSNTAVAGLRSIDALEVDYAALAATPGLTLMRGRVEDLDPVTRRATLDDGRVLTSDRIVLAPGIDFHGEAIEGYDGRAVVRFPHAWESGPATDELRKSFALHRSATSGTVSRRWCCATQAVCVAPHRPRACGSA